MATNLTNAKVYYFTPRDGVCGNMSQVGAWDPVPWGPFGGSTGSAINGDPYLSQLFMNNAQSISEGYSSTVLPTPYHEFQVGSPLPHVIRLTIVPTNTYDIEYTTDPVTGVTWEVAWNRNSTQQLWDGTYTEASWQTYEQLFNAGDPNADSQLQPNLVDVQGYWTIDSKKITISGWSGSDYSIISQYLTTSDPGNMIGCGYATYGQDYTTVSFTQFQGTLYGNDPVPQTHPLSDYTIVGGLLYNNDMSYIYPSNSTDGSNTIGKYGVFKEVDGESQTETSSYRLFSPAGNPGYSGVGEYNLSKGDTSFDEFLVALGNSENANSNIYDNWPEHVQRIILMDTLGVDSNGFGLDGNMVHAYIFHKIGDTVLDDFNLEIDFDGAAEFVIDDPDFEFTETELLSNQNGDDAGEGETTGEGEAAGNF